MLTISPELIRISNYAEEGMAVFTPVPAACREITPALEEVLPKEIPEDEDEEEPDELLGDVFSEVTRLPREPEPNDDELEEVIEEEEAELKLDDVDDPEDDPEDPDSPDVVVYCLV